MKSKVISLHAKENGNCSNIVSMHTHGNWHGWEFFCAVTMASCGATGEQWHSKWQKGIFYSYWYQAQRGIGMLTWNCFEGKREKR